MSGRARWATWAACAAQALTLVWTWDLWQPRDAPPTLPGVGALAGVPFGLLLLGLVALAAARPRVGGPAFLAAWVVAVLADRTRLQPEVVSLGLLMAAPAWGAAGRAIARWHLATTWLWAGLQKVLADGWGDSAGFIAGLLGGDGLRGAVAVGLPAAEVALGAAALWPRAWRWVAGGGVALHAGIVVTLVVGDWNRAVWPWNAALAVAAVVLFGGEREPLLPAVPVRVAAAVLVVTPALFHVGWVPAYLSHNLYSGGTVAARVCDADDGCAPAEPGTWAAFEVPLPPEPALYRQWFDRTCAPGTVLELTGRPTRLRADDLTRHQCPNG